MAFKKDGTGEFKWSYRGNTRIIEEKNNSFIRFGPIAWGVAEGEDCEPDKIKYDIRKFSTDADGNEKMFKGLTFLTHEGPHELTHVLVEEGFGKTEKILDTIKKRSDFPDAVKTSYGDKIEDDIDETFDLRELL